MPRAGDPYIPGGALPLTHDPLQRISYQPVRSVFDVEAFIAAVGEFVDTYLIPVIYDLTGIDLHGVLDLLNILLTVPLEILNATPLGDFLNVVGQFLPFLLNINPLTFNPISAAVTLVTDVIIPVLDFEGPALLNGVLDGITLAPGAVIEMMRTLIGEALQDIPIIGEISQPIIGVVGTIKDLVVLLETNFTNLRALLGIGIEDLLAAEFNAITSIGTFLQDILYPGGLRGVFEAVLGFDASVFSTMVTDVTQVFANLRALFDVTAGNLLDVDFDIAAIIANFITSVLLPNGLTTLLTGAVTSAVNTSEAFTQAVIDAILTVLHGVPIVGGLVSELETAVAGLFGTVNSNTTDISGLQAKFVSPPAHHDSSGTPVSIAADTTYIYGCFAPNSWGRVAWDTTTW